MNVLLIKFKLSERKPLRHLKRLKIVPSLYDYHKLEPLELSPKEKSKYYIKRKSRGYTQYQDLFFQVVLTEYDDNSSSKLILTSNLVEQQSVTNYFNHYFKTFGADEHSEGMLTLQELKSLKNNDDNLFRVWEIRENSRNHYIELLVSKISQKYQLEVTTLNHDI